MPFSNLEIEDYVMVDERLSFLTLLRSEVNRRYGRIGGVVCGPAGLRDEARAIVAAIEKEMGAKCSFELHVDAFSW